MNFCQINIQSSSDNLVARDKRRASCDWAGRGGEEKLAKVARKFISGIEILPNSLGNKPAD